MRSVLTRGLGAACLAAALALLALAPAARAGIPYFVGLPPVGNVAPAVTLTATPTEIVSGSGDTRDWGTCSASGMACLAVTVSGTATSCTPSGFAMSGTASQTVAVSPSATTTYSVYCTNGGINSATASATVTADPAGYFASTSGATAPSSNCATTVATPYSITSVQSCAESSLKPIYVRAGTYDLAGNSGAGDPCGLGANNGPAALNLKLASDSGETWQDYPPDGINTAILNGQCTATACNGTQGAPPATMAGVILCIANTVGSASNPVTINGLKFENVRFAHIFAQGPVHIENSEFTTQFYSGESSGGAVTLNDKAGGSIVEHNYFHDLAEMGVDVNDSVSGAMDNVTVQNNVLFDTCSNAIDCGALYVMMEHTAPPSTGIVFQNNYVRDVYILGDGNRLDYGVCSGGVSGIGNADSGSGCATAYYGAYCLYADQEASDVTWKGNVCTGIVTVGMEIHGGQNNVVYDNIFDLGNDAAPLGLYYQYMSNAWASNTDMTGNDWRHNILIENKAMWNGYAYAPGSGPNTPARVTNNLYYTYAGGSGGATNYLCYNFNNPVSTNYVCSPNLPTTTGENGAVTQDSDPTVGNPLFSACYGAYPQSGSPAFNASVAFPTMPAGWDTAGFWGPPGFQVSTLGTGDSYDSGTAPSWPVGGTCGSAG